MGGCQIRLRDLECSFRVKRKTHITQSRTGGGVLDWMMRPLFQLTLGMFCVCTSERTRAAAARPVFWNSLVSNEFRSPYIEDKGSARRWG